MASVTYLLDKSAWEQAPYSAAATKRISDDIRRGDLAICTMTALEILYSARNVQAYQRDLSHLLGLPWVDLAEPRRAVEVQSELARQGQHRTSIPDVIIAATAAEHDLTILHYDSDYERLSKAAGARQEWIVPRGKGHGNS